MSQWIDFAEIRSRVSLEDVIVRYYRLTTLRREGGRLLGPCPVHGGDAPRAFHADLEKNIWHCFTKCHGGGNALDFVVRKDGINVREAALRLKAFFLDAPQAPPKADKAAVPPSATPTPVPAAPPPAAPPQTTGAAPSTPSTAPPAKAEEANKPLDFTLQLRGDHPHLVTERKLSAETLTLFGVGYCGRGTLRGQIAIPIHDATGKLVAYAGRRLKPSEIDEHGKYKLPKGFHKDLVLYNLHRAQAFAVVQGLILVEGFFSVLKLHEFGFPNVVAAMGSELSDAQAKLLAAFKEVFILFDGNEAGWSGAEKALTALTPHTTPRLIRLPPGLEPEDLTPKALRWALNGARALDLSRLSFELRAPARS